ncbi:polymorphic toxin-type HINT domain-containing protein [Kutzneria sp. 744]|uniref:polymorphic toxin-type HINT domain-containing protein n=1 Tax=Kutzneria sp. (strain 744) TaxID=345341 RepID=UPI0003EEAA8E|nr:polymorphic toxin-type HINT domain-containing protein [Kutzneria sp. 744]EWM17835.1 hypothetical protein KUTG_08139 [Kutzneria sp. 744]
MDLTVKKLATKLGQAGAGLAVAAAAFLGAAGPASADPATLTTTFHHPFYDLTQAAFVDAVDLHPGDQLQTADGATAEVTSVQAYHQTETTYDLTVDGLHTYYVDAGATSVLVHNCANGISMDQAVEMGANHVGGQGRMVKSGSGGWQFINSSVNEAGETVTKIARFDINPNSAHVQKLGPHLNLETQVNGRTVTSGPLKDPHLPIDPSTIRPGDTP